MVPARDPWSATTQTAQALESSVLVAGLSSKMTAQEQAFHLGRAWEALPEPKRPFILHVARPDMIVETFTIGPHVPQMKPEDIMLVHRLWLDITRHSGLQRIHHHDILTAALGRFARDYSGPEQEEILKSLGKMDGRSQSAPAVVPSPRGSGRLEDEDKEPDKRKEEKK